MKEGQNTVEQAAQKMEGPYTVQIDPSSRTFFVVVGPTPVAMVWTWKEDAQRRANELNAAYHSGQAAQQDPIRSKSTQLEQAAQQGEAVAEGVSAQGWMETAAEYARNMDYYRGLVDTIGTMLGEEAHTCDDGSRSESILRAKVPELVAKRFAPPSGQGMDVIAKADAIADQCDFVEDHDRTMFILGARTALSQMKAPPPAQGMSDQDIERLSDYELRKTGKKEWSLYGPDKMARAVAVFRDFLGCEPLTTEFRLAISGALRQARDHGLAHSGVRELVEAGKAMREQLRMRASFFGDGDVAPEAAKRINAWDATVSKHLPSKGEVEDGKG